MEINQYQHKKPRILEDPGNGKFLHHKKRRILEAAQENTDSGGEFDNINTDASANQGGRFDLYSSNFENVDNGEGRLVIDTNGKDNEATGYAHKKLRKDHFDNKELPQEKNSIENGFSEQQVSSDSKIQDQMNMPDLFLSGPSHIPYDTGKDEFRYPNVNLEQAYQQTPLPNPSNPPSSVPPVYPSYPAINMNMFGNFAMPLNIPHPMMYMNPGMFMPPMSNGMMPQSNMMPNPPNMAPTGYSQNHMTTHTPPNLAPHHPKATGTRPDSRNPKQQMPEERSNGSFEEEKTNVVEIYECKICSRKFSQVGNFHNHMKLHSEKVCACGICKLECADSYELQRHMRTTHTGNMPYKCNECDREFSQYNNLRRHLRVHSGKSYKCHICGRTFNEIFYLEMHIGSHTGERTYKCGVCNLTFKDNADLQKHVKTHKAEELHTCDVCGKSFSKACVLRQHKKMHLGIRPYKCDVCSKAFIHRHHLTIHMRMHTSNKPYTCKLCKKDFSQTSHLYKHLRQHALSLGTDVNFDRRNGSSPTAAEIEEMFEKIQASSNIDFHKLDGEHSNSQDSTDKEVSNHIKGAKDRLFEQIDGKSWQNIGSSSTELSREIHAGTTSQYEQLAKTNNGKEINAAARYSPISSASSQCDNQSETGSIDVVNSVDSPNAQEIQEIMKSAAEDLKTAQEIQGLQSDMQNDNKKSLYSKDETKVGTERSIENPKSESNELSNSYLSPQSLGVKMENCQLPFLDTEPRVPDVEAAATESNSDISKSGSLSYKSDSPCPSWSSRSDVSQTESVKTKSSAANSQGSLSDEERKAKKQPAKAKRRRRNTPKGKKDRESVPDNPGGLGNGQMPFLPPMMPQSPKVANEMKNLYLMQLQQLQGLHMALFANAMMSQGGVPGVANQLPAPMGFPESPGYNGSPNSLLSSPSIRGSPHIGMSSPRSAHSYRGEGGPGIGLETYDNRTGPVDLRVEKA